jgi:hypothetical protein
MTNFFLLRFQESRSNYTEGVLTVSGTPTYTNVGTEQVDSVPHSRSVDAVPFRIDQMPHSNSQVLAGTKTMTEIRRESSDTDPTKTHFDSLPKV